MLVVGIISTMEEQKEVEQIAKVFLFSQRIRYLAKTYSRINAFMNSNQYQKS